MGKIKPFLKFLSLLLVVLIISTTYIWLGSICILIQDGIAKVPEVYSTYGFKGTSGFQFSFLIIILAMVFLSELEKNRFPKSVLTAPTIFFIVFLIPSTDAFPKELYGEALNLYKYIANFLWWFYWIFIFATAFFFKYKKNKFMDRGFKSLYVIVMVPFPLVILELYRYTNCQFPANLINFILGLN